MTKTKGKLIKHPALWAGILIAVLLAAEGVSYVLDMTETSVPSSSSGSHGEILINDSEIENPKVGQIYDCQITEFVNDKLIGQIVCS